MTRDSKKKDFDSFEKECTSERETLGRGRGGKAERWGGGGAGPPFPDGQNVDKAAS